MKEITWIWGASVAAALVAVVAICGEPTQTAKTNTRTYSEFIRTNHQRNKIPMKDWPVPTIEEVVENYRTRVKASAYSLYFGTNYETAPKHSCTGLVVGSGAIIIPMDPGQFCELSNAVVRLKIAGQFVAEPPEFKAVRIYYP